MLFLLNNQIVEINAPELHLAQHWKRTGCGEPAGLSAEDAVDFAAMVVNAHLDEGIRMDEPVIKDLAALLISKTGANAAQFNGKGDVRLDVMADAVLAGLHAVLRSGGAVTTDAAWAGIA